jgi:hypothetical protein
VTSAEFQRLLRHLAMNITRPEASDRSLPAIARQLQATQASLP